MLIASITRIIYFLSLFRNGELEAQEVSGEVRIEAKLPGTSPHINVKLRLNKEVDDLVTHRYCKSKGVESIGNSEFVIASITPGFGKFTLLKYFTK